MRRYHLLPGAVALLSTLCALAAGCQRKATTEAVPSPGASSPTTAQQPAVPAANAQEVGGASAAPVPDQPSVMAPTLPAAKSPAGNVSPVPAKPAPGVVTVADLERLRSKIRSFRVTKDLQKPPPSDPQSKLPSPRSMVKAVKLDGGRVTKVRTEVDGRCTITDVANRAVYHYEPRSNRAWTKPLPDTFVEGIQLTNSGGPDLRQLSATAPVTRSETLDGAKCWVIEAPAGADDPSPRRYWVDAVTGLVRQVQIGERRGRLRYSQINAVPDSEFELPSGTRIEKDEGGMVGGNPPSAGSRTAPRAMPGP
jgi:hypothetical protein